MKDHDTGCTFGGCASYSMADQGSWRSDLFGAGLGLYTSNEWPRGPYDDYRDVGSCTDVINSTHIQLPKMEEVPLLGPSQVIITHVVDCSLTRWLNNVLR